MRFIITEEQRQALVDTLGEMPAKFAHNAINMLYQLPVFTEVKAPVEKEEKAKPGRPKRPNKSVK